MTLSLRWPVAALVTLFFGTSCVRGHAGSHSRLQPSPVRVAFTAQSDSFAAATTEYTAIWRREGARIIEAMERVSGLRFDSPPYADTSIGATVFEGVSYSGYRDRPMRLRASYPEPTKRATLVHEFGHRLQIGVAGDEDEHEVLFLWLYDVWVALWGKQFADEQVLVEKARRGPYPRAWDAALALSATERAAKFGRLRDRKRSMRDGHEAARSYVIAYSRTD
jgi:hypothetical protein